MQSVERLFQRLNECHELPAYEAIERLVKTAEAVGLDAETLASMLDQGKTFAQLLKSIELKIEMNLENHRTAA